MQFVTFHFIMKPMNCEKCFKEHDGSYGSGRFCCVACARAYATAIKRDAINKVVAERMIGNKHCSGKKFAPRSEEAKARFAEHVAERVATRWKTAAWDDVPAAHHKSRLILEQNGLCAICSIPAIWNGKPLVFQLDHVSGDRSDASRKNVRMICPNCHSQTPTWGAGNVSDEGKKRIQDALSRGRSKRLTSLDR